MIDEGGAYTQTGEDLREYFEADNWLENNQPEINLVWEQ